MGIWRGVSTIRPVAARRTDLRANASAATAAVLFGASVVAVRVAVRDVPPISLAVLRIGQGGLLLAAILLVVAPDLLRVRWERLRLFALLGLVLFALFPLTFNIGLRYTEASRGAVMLATMPSGARCWGGSPASDSRGGSCSVWGCRWPASPWPLSSRGGRSTPTS